MEKTKVIFRKFNGEVLALFPELPGDSNPYRTCLSYQHIGQHGAAAIDLKAAPATLAEYAPLARELESLGYEIKPARRFTRKDLQARIAATK
jgi:hypothetical protein